MHLEWLTHMIYDLFRCSTALMQVLQQTAYEEQNRSLIIDIWRFEGYLPDARSSNYNGRTQAGSNADNVLADAYVKGVRGAVNWEDGYKAMVKDAEVTPKSPVDPMAPDSLTKEGRAGLYQVASGLKREKDAQKYLHRSRNWRIHSNPNQTSLGFSGFAVPRNTSGFLDTDPLKDSGYWGDPYYEASAESAVKRLNIMFTEGASGSSGMIFDLTNEPMFNVPYLYNYVGRQDLAVSQSRKVAKDNYHTGAAAKNLHITSTGGDGNGDHDIYVQSLKVNGKKWTRSWLTGEDIFAQGGTLAFKLGRTAVNWTNGELPPSPASE
ncbi:hypothetical protein NUU61_006832 [Penicillium alfredii]|uniref:Glycosyl hydrolase family 92 domain-containing protein n=1 Tax=Penicillium alfredii TaxID=1506179 RepID=A0A9W9F1N0_9EURO|nr:uncharacterized protein NUU61_006832 [Penicillium alfredii]KAJ5091962.1 hypothetical protein NUU61_006832 [Penicillium alfredii]